MVTVSERYVHAYCCDYYPWFQFDDRDRQLSKLDDDLYAAIGRFEQEFDMTFFADGAIMPEQYRRRQGREQERAQGGDAHAGDAYRELMRSQMEAGQRWQPWAHYAQRNQREHGQQKLKGKARFKAAGIATRTAVSGMLGRQGDFEVPTTRQIRQKHERAVRDLASRVR
jgi:hypothetical protein